MAHRSRRRKAPWRAPDASRPSGLGTHWRADGAPKTAYRSQRDALSAADERRLESDADLNVYCCDFCGAWHMGNRRGRDT